jgi:hypothetical protein
VGGLVRACQKGRKLFTHLKKLRNRIDLQTGRQNRCTYIIDPKREFSFFGVKSHRC